MTNRPAIGQKVRYVAKFSKSRWPVSKRDPRFPADFFMVVKWRRGKLWKPGEGFYIGFRSVYDGEIQQGEDGSRFRPEASHTVWLIVPDERSNPVRVLPEDVEILQAVEDARD